MHALCNLSLVPVRKEPSDKSEMITQLLFGEGFEIMETRNQWRRIRTDFDQYEGWVDEKQFVLITDPDHKKLVESSSILTLDLLQVAIEQDRMIPVLLGSTLPSFIAGNFVLGDKEYSYEGNVRNCSKEYTKKTVVDNAMMYFNAPYLWGGRSPFGIDCSGLTQMAYKMAGIKLWRDANQQASQGITLHLLEESVPGDLAFFDNEDGNITHTGILLSGNQVIHASGKVRIDKIDHQGIFNVDTKRYSHHLRLVKKIV